MDPLAWAAAYARVLALGRAMQGTPVEEIVKAIEQLLQANPGFDDTKARDRGMANVAVAEAVARAALEFKRAISRVLPVAEVRVL